MISGLVLYRLTDFIAANQAVLKVITPPTTGAESRLHYGLTLGAAGNSVTSGNQIYIQDIENRSNAAHLYFDMNIAPLYKLLDKMANDLLTVLEGMPLSEMVKDAMLATANYRLGMIRSGFAVAEFLEIPDEEYIKDYEVAVNLHYKGLTILQGFSKRLTNSAQELIDKLLDKDKQFINHTEKIFEIKRGNDHHLHLKHRRETVAYYP